MTGKSERFVRCIELYLARYCKDSFLCTLKYIFFHLPTSFSEITQLLLHTCFSFYVLGKNSTRFSKINLEKKKGNFQQPALKRSFRLCSAILLPWQMSIRFTTESVNIVVNILFHSEMWNPHSMFFKGAVSRYFSQTWKH